MALILRDEEKFFRKKDITWIVSRGFKSIPLWKELSKAALSSIHYALGNSARLLSHPLLCALAREGQRQVEGDKEWRNGGKVLMLRPPLEESHHTSFLPHQLCLLCA